MASNTLQASASVVRRNKIKTFFSKPYNVILVLMGLVLTVTTVAPIVAIVEDTFKIHPGTIDAHLTGQVSGYTLVNYIDLFTSSLARTNLWEPLWNTVLLAVGTCVVSILFGGLFDRLKKQFKSTEDKGEDDSKSGWLGDDEESPEDEGGLWRGGAAPRAGLRLVGDDEVMPETEEVPSEEDLRAAVLSLGDDALIAHDIWFVALGGSSLDHAGMKAFLNEHRSEIRGSFVVNLDCIGAGALTLLKNEGLENTRRADRRVSRLLMSAASDLHVELEQRPLDWDTTDATPAMRRSLRSVTIRGVDENGLPALSHTADDVPENVSGDQAARVTEIVTEMIRRS